MPPHRIHISQEQKQTSPTPSIVFDVDGGSQPKSASTPGPNRISDQNRQMLFGGIMPGENNGSKAGKKRKSQASSTATSSQFNDINEESLDSPSAPESGDWRKQFQQEKKKAEAEAKKSRRKAKQELKLEFEDSEPKSKSAKKSLPGLDLNESADKFNETFREYGDKFLVKMDQQQQQHQQQLQPNLTSNSVPSWLENSPFEILAKNWLIHV